MNDSSTFDNKSIVFHIQELLRNISSDFASINNTSTHPTNDQSKHVNQVVPLFLIFGSVIIVFIYCVMAKSRKYLKKENTVQEDVCSWYSGNEEATKFYKERMLDHKAICHDHRSHNYHYPHNHGGFRCDHQNSQSDEDDGNS